MEIKPEWHVRRSKWASAMSPLWRRSPNVVTRVEAGLAVNNSTTEAIRPALEAAGVEFTNGERPGVRMKGLKPR